MIKNKGITLIALVITIIVMLILVTVTITMAVNGKLFEYAGKATSDTKREINKETSIASLRANMTTDELIEQFGPEKEWSVAWVYKNSNWSNPFFKDKSLENDFEFEYIDTDYSLTSEDELEGDIVIKLYTDGMLKISGNGAIPDLRSEENSYPNEPWLGGYNELYEYEGALYRGYFSEYEFEQYLNNTISTIKFEEGITSIPRWSFSYTKANNVYLPSTLTFIDTEAFRDSAWLNSFWGKENYYIVGGNEDWVEVTDAGGHVWRLISYIAD